jgi:hypothetical protein
MTRKIRRIILLLVLLLLLVDVVESCHVATVDPSLFSPFCVVVVVLVVLLLLLRLRRIVALGRTLCSCTTAAPFGRNNGPLGRGNDRVQMVVDENCV